MLSFAAADSRKAQLNLLSLILEFELELKSQAKAARPSNKTDQRIDRPERIEARGTCCRSAYLNCKLLLPLLLSLLWSNHLFIQRIELNKPANDGFVPNESPTWLHARVKSVYEVWVQSSAQIVRTDSDESNLRNKRCCVINVLYYQVNFWLTDVNFVCCHKVHEFFLKATTAIVCVEQSSLIFDDYDDEIITTNKRAVKID